MDSELYKHRTTAFMKAFKTSWGLAIDDYMERRINGEHTLQASLYRHIWSQLSCDSGDYRIFTEAAVKYVVPEGKGRSQKLDLLVVCGLPGESLVVAAIELKFKPRGIVKKKEIQKDLHRLSMVSNRKDMKANLTIERFQPGEAETFKIPADRKLIFAAFCNFEHAESAQLSKRDTFWKNNRPKSPEFDGRWSEQKWEEIFPPNLGVALAITNKKTRPDTSFFGRTFEKLLCPQSVTS